MHRFAPSDTSLTFVALAGPHVILRVGQRTEAGEKHVVARFTDEQTAREHARDVLRSKNMRFSDALERFGPRSAFGIGLPDGRLHVMEIAGLTSDLAQTPALIFALSPPGTQFGAVLEAVGKAVASGTVLPEAPTAATAPRAIAEPAPGAAIEPAPAPAAPPPAKPAPPKPPSPKTPAPKPVPARNPMTPPPVGAATPAPGPLPVADAPRSGAAEPVQAAPPEDDALPAPVPLTEATSTAFMPIVHPKTGKRLQIRDHEVGRWPTVRDNTLRVQVTEFGHGRFYVDIRRWYEKDGQLLPSKGARLGADELDALQDAINEARAIIARAEALDASRG